MGDPRKKRRQYARPQHLWREERIIEEGNLCKKYGLKNRKDIWKVISKVRNFSKQTRKLLAMKGEEAEKGEKELLSKLRKWGITVKNLEDVLALKVEDLLDRRLESIVHKKGLTNTMKQARQFITHGHILVRGRVVNIPSYLVSSDEEREVSLKEKIKVVSSKKNKKEVKSEKEGKKRKSRRRKGR